MFGEENHETPPILIKLEEGTSQLNVYCWKCGKDNTNFRCAKCSRHFHETCLKKRFEEDWTCKECTVNDFKSFAVKFIPNILDSIIADEQFITLMDIKFTTENAIDIPQMKQKSYETSKQFENDIKWFRHNCRTIYSQEREIQKASNRLIAFVEDQIEDILACDECYENACKFGPRSLVMTCSKPHLILWHRVGDYGCYWPAKLMTIDVEKRKVQIRFFSDYTKEIVSADYCYLYSKDHPMKKVGHRKSYRTAIKDASEYIENIRLKFGAYNFGKYCTAFDPERMQDYLKQMIAEEPITDFDESEFDVSVTNKRNRNSMPQKSTNGPPPKKSRNENEVNAIVYTFVDTMQSNFKSFVERAAQKMKYDVGQHFQRRLNEADNEKMVLEHTIDVLNIEKADLERDNAALKKQQSDEKNRYDAFKFIFDQTISDLHETHHKEKTALEDRIAALELKKNEVNCAHCQTVLQPVMFCSSDCGKKHYANGQ